MAGQNRTSNDNFPTTQQSALFGLRSADSVERNRSLGRLARAYWKPIYKYVRLHWHKEPAEAEEITQAFFLRTIDKDTFATYEPERARFRTFVRVCVDRFVLDIARRGAAKKREGEMRALQFDFQAAEGELSSEENLAGAAALDPEKLFETEWVRHVFEMAIEALRASCIQKGKEIHFRAFELFHLDDAARPPSYAAASAELGMSVTDLTNRLSYARREFRALVLDILRELTGSEQELRNEARAVLGLEL
ncbi:RNA polymerase sigma factor [Pendulispora albinea]|uniref:RNA polymerase sigma-70 region 2 domain-containing protein n=1 Tax=Pendulispora albinea TaxID=2741071 RepID=A0ABZ2M7T5_9BACT